MDTLAELLQRRETARAAAKANPCKETREAASAAWAAYEEAYIAVNGKKKTGGICASRAGQRQYAERAALHSRRR